MRTLRSLVLKRGQGFFHRKLWELWEAWFQRDDLFSFNENHENYERPNFKKGTSILSMIIMSTMRILISKRGEVFFYWKSWEPWEAWFQRGDKFSFTENMRTMRIMISKGGLVFFHWKSWELWEAWFQRGDKFSFSEKSWELWEAWYQRGQDFFLFKSWELWEAWFQREDKISFSWNHENHENSHFKEDQNVAFMKSLIWDYDNFSCSHAPGPGYQVFTGI